MCKDPDMSEFAKEELSSLEEKKSDLEKQIEIISQQEDTIYLILNSNYSINWQTPTKVIQYVKENFTQNGTVGIYDIYEKAQ